MLSFSVLFTKSLSETFIESPIKTFLSLDILTSGFIYLLRILLLSSFKLVSSINFIFGEELRETYEPC